MTKKKKGVAVADIAAVAVLCTGFAFAANLDVDSSEAVNSGAAAFSSADIESLGLEDEYKKYEEFGLVYNKPDGKLYYNGETVRYFEDYYPLWIDDENSSCYAGLDFFDEDGTVDVHAVRDLSGVEYQSDYDGSYDPSGVLIGVQPYSQEEFDARDIEPLKTPTTIEVEGSEGYDTSYDSGQHIAAESWDYEIDSESDEVNESNTPTTHVAASGWMSPDEMAKEYAIYEPFGVTYDKEADLMYYSGKPVGRFLDVMAGNGKDFSGGEFEGVMRNLNFDKGEINIETVRDYDQPDDEGYGKLIRIEVVD